jgi:hypothetical protein
MASVEKESAGDCPRCARWLTEWSDSLAEDGQLIELLRVQATQAARGANLGWGLAAAGWLLLAAAVARMAAAGMLL